MGFIVFLSFLGIFYDHENNQCFKEFDQIPSRPKEKSKICLTEIGVLGF